ncbi:MAG: flavodoxin-dependent (E)-4-hydroxy-3-methylbut-2-enyl-diphosphate synthase [Planctomycetes bacterium]|nr:flavodoxin-dependent (E)-4-hydroxy-3-methylbut-2-enyl-diphosphate synthase [Planctomycetota bacterium]
MQNQLDNRRPTRVVKVGSVSVGGDHPIVVQSMTITDTRDVDATVAQCEALAEAGCEMVRVAVVDDEAANCLRAIKERIQLPLIADIHFNYKHALTAIEQGVDKVRINPGNIGGEKKFIEVIRRLRDAGMPSRIGVNAGSLEMDLIEKYGYPTAQGLVESAMRHIEVCERENYRNFIVSLKSSSVPMTMRAYRLFAEKVADYPLHLGVTEAGDPQYGAIKSAAGLGGLLVDGIGDTIRVSLLGDPTIEIPVAFDILKATGRRVISPEIVACPSCGRIEIDLEKIVAEVKQRLGKSRLPVVVSVLGCVVNGPGEAREADIGIAAGRGFGMLFKHGVMVRKLKEDEMVDALCEEISIMEAERAAADASIQA